MKPCTWLQNAIRHIIIVVTALASAQYMQPAEATPIPLWDGMWPAQLIGARSIEVNGQLFDVEFVDGSCNAIWNGCDKNTFTFEEAQDAQDASQALLNQLLLGSTPPLAGNPGLIYGVHDMSYRAIIMTPWDVTIESNGDVIVSVFSVFNAISNEYDVGYEFPLARTLMQADMDRVYARWTMTPVPEPVSIVLFGIGLAGLAFTRPKRKASV